MIYGQIVTSIVAFYVDSYYTGKLLSYTIIEQFKDYFPVVGLSSLMGVGVYLLKYLPIQNSMELLLSQISTGIILYISLCGFTKLFSFLEIISIAQEKYNLLRHRGEYF